MAHENDHYVGLVSRHLATLLASRVRLLRATKGWTIRELENRSGVPRSTITKVEGGEHMPEMKTILALAIALEVSALEEMFGTTLPSRTAFLRASLPRGDDR